jgi:predicted DNA-binding transcriptional regulator AlpA
MIACWQVNYGLDTRTPADAMRYWDERCNGMAPAGAVAALGLCIDEIERLRSERLAFAQECDDLLAELAEARRDVERAAKEQPLPTPLQDCALVTAAMAAAAGSVHRGTWYAMVKTGRAPPPVVRAHRLSRWRMADVKAFWARFAEEGSATDAEGATVRRARESRAARTAKKKPASGRAAPGRTIPNSMKHRFQPGLKSWNKGTRYRAGGRSVEHQFQPGQLPHNTVPVGTEVIGVDGYLKRKISDSRQSHARFNWKFVHVLVWEEHHGPVPKGHRLSFKNGDKADIRIDNLELVTHVEHMRRNSIHTVLPPELRHVVQLNGALKRKINRRVDSEKQD